MHLADSATSLAPLCVAGSGNARADGPSENLLLLDRRTVIVLAVEQPAEVTVGQTPSAYPDQTVTSTPFAAHDELWLSTSTASNSPIVLGQSVSFRKGT